MYGFRSRNGTSSFCDNSNRPWWRNKNPKKTTRHCANGAMFFSRAKNAANRGIEIALGFWIVLSEDERVKAVAGFSL